MPTRAELEQSLALLETYNRQIEALSRQVAFLQALYNETSRAREALEGLRAEKSQEILVPIGAGTFLYAESAKKDRVLTGIGAGLSLETSWEQAEQGLAQREKEIGSEMQRLSEGVVRLQQEAAVLQEEIQENLPADGEAPLTG